MKPEEDMLRIGVVSDSHEDEGRLFLAARRLGRLDVLCFLGDVVGDAEYLQTQLGLLGRSAVCYTVRGNNDFASAYPAELTVELMGRKLLLTHGHLWGVKMGLGRLAYHAQESHADIVLFGHTHVPYSGYDRNIFFLNPGAASYRRPTCAVLTLTAEKLELEMLQL